MYRVKYTSAYKKHYKLMARRGADVGLLDRVVDQLRRGVTLDPSYNDHPLVGNYRGFRECHVRPDWLLIYLMEDDILTLTLVDTGSHSDLY